MTKPELLNRFIFIANHINFNSSKLDMPWEKTGQPTNLDFRTIPVGNSKREIHIFMKFIYDNFYHEVSSVENTQKLSAEYWKIAQAYVSAEVEDKWLVQKIYDGGFIQAKKGLMTTISWAFEPENPTNSLKKFDFILRFPPIPFTARIFLTRSSLS